MDKLQLQPFDYNNVEIRLRQSDNFYCLTDMWIANGSNPSKRPVDWFVLPQSKDFIKSLESNNFYEVGFSHFIETSKGKGLNATWAHYQVAIAYAKYLDPKFHIYVNEVFKRYKTGELETNPYSDIIPKTYADALIQLGNEIKRRELVEASHKKQALLIEQQGDKIAEKDIIIAEQEPDVIFSQTLQKKKGTIYIKQFANQIGIGEKDLFKLLRKLKILQSSNGRYWNIPYGKYIKKGYFKIKENIISGKEDLGFTTKITTKGQKWLHDLLLEMGYIQPELFS